MHRPTESSAPASSFRHALNVDPAFTFSVSIVCGILGAIIGAVFVTSYVAPERPIPGLAHPLLVEDWQSVCLVVDPRGNCRATVLGAAPLNDCTWSGAPGAARLPRSRGRRPQRRDPAHRRDLCRMGAAAGCG